MIVADAHEAAKAQDGIGDLAAALFHQEALDGADMLAIGVIDLGAFDLVRGDQVMGFLDVGSGDTLVIIGHLVLLDWGVGGERGAAGEVSPAEKS